MPITWVFPPAKLEGKIDWRFVVPQGVGPTESVSVLPLGSVTLSVPSKVVPLGHAEDIATPYVAVVMPPSMKPRGFQERLAWGFASDAKATGTRRSARANMIARVLIV